MLVCCKEDIPPSNNNNNNNHMTLYNMSIVFKIYALLLT